MNEELKKRMEEAVEKAQENFWQSICESFPEVKTGDLPPEVVFQFDQTCTSAVKLWLESNHPNCQ